MASFGIVGVPMKQIFTEHQEERTRPRYNIDTGAPSDFSYKQLVIKVCGQEIPVEDDMIFAQPDGCLYRSAAAGYCMKANLNIWLKKHQLQLVGGPNRHQCILGIETKGWAYHKDNEPYVSIELDHIRDTITEAKKRLKKIGYNGPVKFYMLDRP